MAFFLSLLAGGLVAQQMAVATKAGEEYILVFMAIAPVAIVFAVVFFIAQFRANARGAVNAAARWSLVILAMLTLALFGFEYWATAGDFAKIAADLPIIGGLLLPAVAIILIDWLFVRWRVGRLPATFGRGERTS